jgi:hypothetical protein
MPLHEKRPEEQYKSQPKMPTDRPPTKQEVWDWVVHMYGGIFEEAKLRQMAQDKWAWAFVWEVNFRGWKKHPDWVPGDPIIADAVAPGPFPPEAQSFLQVNKLWAIAQAELERQAA